MKRILLLFTIGLIQFNNVNACSCSGESAFCDINFANPNHHIFIGKVLSQDSISAKFQVIDRIRGFELLDTITIWDYNDTLVPGINCLSAASSSIGNVGDSILIILSKINSLTQHNQHASIGDYFAPSNFCAVPVLGIRNQNILGNLTLFHPYTSPLTPYVIDTISIVDFKLKFNPSPGAINCDLFVGIENPKSDELELTIFPNPSYEEITVESTQEISSIRVFNSIGAEMRSVFIHTNSTTINVSDETPGIYFMEIEFSDGMKTIKKFIKQAN